MSGTLFVVATPIGNLEDMTLRGIRVLGEVDVIAAEDTRRTSKLLAHYKIRRPLLSLREHNETRETPKLISRLQRGESIALVTDAGTPGIADPGARFVAAARAAGLPVLPVPGPSAIAAALSVSGFSFDQFVFLGFPSSSGPSRDEWLARLQHDPRPAVFFESPHRIKRTLKDVAALLVNRPIMTCREISKMNESYVIYQNNSLPEAVDERGEFTVVVSPSVVIDAEPARIEMAVDMIGRMANSETISDDVVVEMVSAFAKVPARRLRSALKKHRIAMKQQESRNSER